MSFGDELINHADELVAAWYESWKRSPHPHPDVGEAALKNMLADQFRLIGEQIQKADLAENTDALWKITERLDPEKRFLQKIPIEEVVHEYRIAVETVRNWVESEHIQVEFREYSYFYRAMFELVAESVRRYAAFSAESVSIDRSEYLAGLTHQMRNPLSAIQTQLELLALSGDPEFRKEVLAKLQQSVKRLNFLVNGVMRLERFKAGEIPVHVQIVSPADLVQQVIDENEEQAFSKRISLESAVSHTLRMSADPDLLLDALGNLVQNAVKYTKSGIVRIEVREEQKAVYFRVVDSGPGIRAEQQQSLFKLSKSKKGGGMGIGLTIAKRAVQAQQGEIGFESRFGKGSSFWFRLPKAVRGRNEVRESKSA